MNLRRKLACSLSLRDGLRVSLALLLTGAAGCITRPPSDAEVQAALQRNPDLIFQAITNHPEKFIAAAARAEDQYRQIQRAKAELAEKNRRAEQLKNPKLPEITPDRATLGRADAPITLVSYSDFQCPHCARGSVIADELRRHYGDRLRVVFKHLPAASHPAALTAARYYEAIALQSADKAHAFHDEVFRNQSALVLTGEPFLNRTAEKVGADLARVKADLASPVIAARLQADRAEATKFGILGTPGFVVAGVAIQGAYPVTDFQDIIDRKLSGGDPNQPLAKLAPVEICRDAVTNPPAIK